MFSILFPARCALCDGILNRSERNAGCHDICLMSVRKIEGDRCFKCGKHLPSENMEYCEDCMKMPKTFERNLSLFEYGGDVKDALIRFKYNGRREYKKFFGNAIMSEYKDYISGVDALVPIPVHKSRLKERGYNQAKLLADEISRYSGIAVYDNILLRTSKTTAQKGLNNVERLSNLKNAFQVNQNIVQLKKIMLVDDIYTTGATIEACTRVLKDAGYDKIYSVTVASGRGY